jgi:hypothetical protein
MQEHTHTHKNTHAHTHTHTHRTSINRFHYEYTWAHSHIHKHTHPHAHPPTHTCKHGCTPIPGHSFALTCPDCGKCFRTAIGFHSHRRIHTKTTRGHALKTHVHNIRVHTGLFRGLQLPGSFSFFTGLFFYRMYLLWFLQLPGRWRCSSGANIRQDIWLYK